MQKAGGVDHIYSVHEPAVACIAKGKAGKQYEYGNKVSLAVTQANGWIIGAKSFTGNPYDWHTLRAQLEQTRAALGGLAMRRIHIDMGYRGHGIDDAPEQIIIWKKSRGHTPRKLWREMKRRSRIEAVISHCKQEHRMGRNRLSGILGDSLNALMSAAAKNLRKLLHLIRSFFVFIFQNLNLFFPRFYTLHSA